MTVHLTVIPEGIVNIRNTLRKLARDLVLFSQDERQGMSHWLAARRLQKDLLHVTPGRKCASCGGHATELRLSIETAQWTCKDRATCRETLIYRSMLDSMP